MIGYYSAIQKESNKVIHVWLAEDGSEVEVTEVSSRKERGEEHKKNFKDSICKGKVIRWIQNKHY